MKQPTETRTSRSDIKTQLSVSKNELIRLLRLSFPVAGVLFVLLNSSAVADQFEQVRIRLINGSSIRATIDGIDQQGNIKGSEILDGVSLEEIVGLDTGRAPVENFSDGKVVHLKFGGRIPFSNLRVENEKLSVETGDVKRQFDLEFVRAIIWNQTSSVSAAMTDSSPDTDSVVVQTKQGERVVKGILESVDATHVNIVFEGKSRKISRAKVVGIVTAKLEFARPAGAMASIYTVDGAKLTVGIREYVDGTLQVALSNKHEMTIEADSISRISIQSERIAYLSDLEPVKVEQQSQFTAPRPWKRDKSLMGNPIQLKFASSSKQHVFEKGIGTRSFTSLTFANTGEFNQFRSVVGIDAETLGHGDCEMVVEGDGIRLWSKRVRATDDPEPIVVDISDIREVALIVAPGENFDLADHADWADARFMKTN